MSHADQSATPESMYRHTELICILAMATGLIGVALVALIPLAAVIVGVVSIACAVEGMRHGKRKSLAVSGLILGILNLFFSLGPVFIH